MSPAGLARYHPTASSCSVPCSSVGCACAPAGGLPQCCFPWLSLVWSSNRSYAAVAARQESSMPTTRSRLSPEIDLDGDGKQTGFLPLPYSVHRSASGWGPIPIAQISNTGGKGPPPRLPLLAG